MSSLLGLDRTLLLALNGLAGRHGLLDWLMIACAKDAPAVFALALVALWLSWKPGVQRAAFLAGAAALLALGIGQIVGMMFPRLRPYEVFGPAQVRLLVPHSPDTSFPSDHATLAFAVTIALWALDRRLGIASLALSLWLAVARVYIGAHYPTDVIGGAILGAVVAVVVLWTARHEPGRRAIDWLFHLLARLHVAARARSSASTSRAAA